MREAIVISTVCHPGELPDALSPPDDHGSCGRYGLVVLAAIAGLGVARGAGRSGVLDVAPPVRRVTPRARVMLRAAPDDSPLALLDFELAEADAPLRELPGDAADAA